MPFDKATQVATAAQVTAGSGAVVLTFTEVDVIVKLVGMFVAILALFFAQYWHWRRDIRERKAHAAQMENHRLEMVKLKEYFDGKTKEVD